MGLIIEYLSTGLFLGSGSALHYGGPAGLLLVRYQQCKNAVT